MTQMTQITAMRFGMTVTRRTLAAILASALLAPTIFAQTTTTATRTRTHVETLASEKFEGRQAGSDGERRAAEYIAGELARLGAKPLPGSADSFHSFQFTAGAKDAGSTIVVHREGQP